MHDRLMQYLKKLGLGIAEYPSGVEYHVKTGGEDDLFFTTRKHARLYKRILKLSKQNPEAHIIRREYDDGFIASEKEVY